MRCARSWSPDPANREVLGIEQVPMPEPGPGQIRVRVRAFGINRADLLQRRGHYPAPPGAVQNILGLEYAGEIDALGPDVEGLAVGDRVMGIVAGGSYAEHVTTPANHALPIPDEMSFEDAAAIPEAYLTGYDALEQLQVAAGEWVLIHAVGSGVGTATVQLVRARGARSIGTSRTASKLGQASALGLDAGIDSTSEENLKTAVRKITGRGVEALVDLIGGPDFNSSLQALNSGGRALIVGLTAGYRAELDLGLILRHRLQILGTVLRTRPDAAKAGLAESFKRSALPLVVSGQLKPVIDRVFAFDQAAAAHRYLEQNASFGKVVVTVD